MGRDVKHMLWSPTGGCVAVVTKSGDIEVVHFVIPEKYVPNCSASVKNFFSTLFGGDKKGPESAATRWSRSAHVTMMDWHPQGTYIGCAFSDGQIVILHQNSISKRSILQEDCDDKSKKVLLCKFSISGDSFCACDAKYATCYTRDAATLVWSQASKYKLASTPSTICTRDGSVHRSSPLGRTDVHYVIGTEEGNLYGLNSHGECLIKTKKNAKMSFVAFHEESSTIIYVTGSFIYCLDSRNSNWDQKNMYSLNEAPTKVCLRGEVLVCLSDDGLDITLVDVMIEEMWNLKRPKKDTFKAADYSPKRDMIAASTNKNYVYVWKNEETRDGPTYKVAADKDMNFDIYEIAYSPSGMMLAVNDGDHVLFFEDDQIFDKEREKKEAEEKRKKEEKEEKF